MTTHNTAKDAFFCIWSLSITLTVILISYNISFINKRIDWMAVETTTNELPKYLVKDGWQVVRIEEYNKYIEWSKCCDTD